MEQFRLWPQILLITGTIGVKIHRLDVPDAVRAGSEVRLTCDYDLEGQTLRTVKWYKGSHEFYRYDPRSYPEPKKFFVLQKLYLNEQLCDSKSVVLKDVHADMSGYYTCEVTTQVIYETVQMKHYLLVVQPPRVPPEISGVPVGGLTSGEWLRVSCHLPWMNVKPSLEFWVNDRRARHMNDIQVQKILKENVKGRKKMRPFEYSVVSMEDHHGAGPRDEGRNMFEDEEAEAAWEDGGTTTILEFPVRKHHVREGKVQVKCKASAAKGLYEQETIVNVPVVRSFSFFDTSDSSRLIPSLTVLVSLYHICFLQGF